jgi:hypothetical protein
MTGWAGRPEDEACWVLSEGAWRRVVEKRGEIRKKSNEFLGWFVSVNKYPRRLLAEPKNP